MFAIWINACQKWKQKKQKKEKRKKSQKLKICKVQPEYITSQQEHRGWNWGYAVFFSIWIVRFRSDSFSILRTWGLFYPPLGKHTLTEPYYLESVHSAVHAVWRSGLQTSWMRSKWRQKKKWETFWRARWRRQAESVPHHAQERHRWCWTVGFRRKRNLRTASCVCWLVRRNDTEQPAGWAQTCGKSGRILRCGQIHLPGASSHHSKKCEEAKPPPQCPSNSRCDIN